MIEPKFQIRFLEDAIRFLGSIDEQASDKIIYNIDKARWVNDPRLFKKIHDDIWEFRTVYSGIQYRLMAFWDKSTGLDTFVIATHGMIKKTDKLPGKEIEKAIAIRKKYLIQKNSIMKSKEIKSYSLDEVKDKFIGEKGTPKREAYEMELSMELLGIMIKKTRQKRGMNQEQLGKLIGVQKSWISRLENNTTNVSIDTLMKVFSALNARINFSVNLNAEKAKVA